MKRFGKLGKSHNMHQLHKYKHPHLQMLVRERLVKRKSSQFLYCSECSEHAAPLLASPPARVSVSPSPAAAPVPDTTDHKHTAKQMTKTSHSYAVLWH